MITQAQRKRLEEALLRYRANPARFAVEVIHQEPTDQQLRLYRAAAPAGAKVAVASGHGVGKTSFLAGITLWGICCLPRFKGRATAPTRAQAEDVYWSELRLWYKRMDPWWRRQVNMKSGIIHLAGEPEHHLTVRTARREVAEAFQGVHAENVLLLGDEASGIPDEIFEAGRGSMSTPGARMILCSNPTRNQGRFYTICTTKPKGWEVIRLSSLDSPLVDPSFAADIAEEYGEDSDYYRVRVLGLFPREEVAQLISRALAEMAARRRLHLSEYSYAPAILGVDPAWEGDDRSVIILRQGLYSEVVGVWNRIDNVDLADQVAQAEEDHKTVATFVDIGWGAGVVDRLRHLGRDPIPVNFGGKSTSKAYRNKRTEMWFKMRAWLESGGRIEPRQDLMDDLVAPHYQIDENTGKKVLERKKDIKTRGLRSPDLGDALALTFAGAVKPEPTPEDRMLYQAMYGDQTKAATEYDILSMKR